MRTIALKQRVREASSSFANDLAMAVESTRLSHHPFDHIYMEQVFDPETYRTMVEAMPERRAFHELIHRDALRPDGTSTRLRLYLYPELLGRLPAAQRWVWVTLARALCSRELERAFKRKFRSALEQRFGKAAESIRLYPVPILLRDQPGYRIGIHADVSTKAITVQFYLPRDGSQRHIGTIFHEGKDGPAAERTTQMPFLPSSGYAFPVTASKSWHSAALTSDSDGERVTMMVTYYVAETPHQWLKLRLRRLALRFGIRPKG
jgi:hypothetical protein